MYYVEFYNWQHGYRKVESTKLFQEYFGIGLKEAHQRTNTLLDKQPFVLSVESAEKADEVVKRFTEIGALCRLTDPIWKVNNCTETDRIVVNFDIGASTSDRDNIGYIYSEMSSKLSNCF